MEDIEKSHKSSVVYHSIKKKNSYLNEDSGAASEKTSKSRSVCLPAAIADGLARHHAHEQLVFKQKLKKLKKIIKNLVLENGALCDTVSTVQDELALAIEERQYLLRKVMQIQLSTDQSLLSHHDFSKAFLDADDDGDRPSRRHDERGYMSLQSNRHLLMSRKHVSMHEGEKAAHAAPPSKSRSRWKKNSKTKRKCPPLPLDASGRPVFPLILGRLTIHSLGEIVGDKEAYHNEAMIFPVGFCSSRMYASLTNPHQQTLYTCTIKEGGNRPKFDIVCDEDEMAFYGNSAAECHSQILKKINMILGIDLLPTSTETVEAEQRGLRFFGLSHPSVQNMIQACTGARKCSKYKWIQFEICKTEAEAEDILDPEREASICHETLLRNIRFASNHM